MASPVVFADACVLVMDMVAFTLYDLHATGIINLHWTPDVEQEYIARRGDRHAFKLRKEDFASFEDLLWASDRMETIKKHLVPNPYPQGWEFESTVFELSKTERFLPMKDFPDPKDTHVAIGAAYLASLTGSSVILTTADMGHFPTDVLETFNIAVMHPGALLEALYHKDPDRLLSSLLKTGTESKKRKSSPEEMMAEVVRNKQQFYCPELAREIRQRWNLPSIPQKSGRDNPNSDQSDELQR